MGQSSSSSSVTSSSLPLFSLRLYQNLNLRNLTCFKREPWRFLTTSWKLQQLESLLASLVSCWSHQQQLRLLLLLLLLLLRQENEKNLWIVPGTNQKQEQISSKVFFKRKLSSPLFNKSFLIKLKK